MSSKITKIAALLLVVLVSMGSINFAALSADASRPGAELTVDAWVLTKMTKAGDSFRVFANTSYTAGVTVTAKIFRYNFPALHTAKALLEAGDLRDAGLSGVLNATMLDKTTVVANLTLSANTGASQWTVYYTVPTDAKGGLYGVEVIARDGVKIATDNPTIQLRGFYDEKLAPMVSAARAVNTELDSFIRQVDAEIGNFTAMLDANGGIKGIVENITNKPTWRALVNRTQNDSNYSSGISALIEVLNFLKGPDGVQAKDTILSIKNYYKAILLEGLIGKLALLPIIAASQGGNNNGGNNPSSLSVSITDAEDTATTFVSDTNPWKDFIAMNGQNQIDGAWMAPRPYISQNGTFAFVARFVNTTGSTIHPEMNISVSYEADCGETGSGSFILPANESFNEVSFAELGDAGIRGIARVYAIGVDCVGGLGDNETIYISTSPYDTITRLMLVQGGPIDIEGLNFFARVGTQGQWELLTPDASNPSYTLGAVVLENAEDGDIWNTGESVYLSESQDNAVTDIIRASNTTQQVYVKITSTSSNTVVYQSGSPASTTRSKNIIGDGLTVSDAAIIMQRKQNITNAVQGILSLLRAMNGTREMLYLLENMGASSEIEELNASMQAIRASQTKLYALYNATVTLDELIGTGYFENASANLEADMNTSVRNIPLVHMIMRMNNDTVQSQMDSLVNGNISEYQQFAMDVWNTTVISSLGPSVNATMQNISAIASRFVNSSAVANIQSLGSNLSAYMDASNGEAPKHLLLETLDELFLVSNLDVIAATDYFAVAGVGNTATVNFTVMNAAGAAAGASLVATVLYVDPIQAQLLGQPGQRVAPLASSGSDSSITLSSPDFPGKIIYAVKATTDSRGKASITFPIENYGVYGVLATVESASGERGAIATAVLAEKYVPRITLTQVGTFAGFPVYKNPSAIGENFTFDVILPSGTSANIMAGIGSFNMSAVVGNIAGVNYIDFNLNRTITGVGEITMKANGPISGLGIIAEKTLSNGAHEGNVLLGFLLSSQANVTIDAADLAMPGVALPMTVSAASGSTVKNTYGVGMLSDAIELSAFDVTGLTNMLYGNVSDRVLESMTDNFFMAFQTKVMGTGSTAVMGVPSLLIRGDYTMLTISVVTVNGVDKLAAGIATTTIYGKAATTTTTQPGGTNTTGGAAASTTTINATAGAAFPILVQIDGTAIAGATVRLLLGTTIVANATTSSTGEATITLPAAGGQYTLRVEKDGVLISQNNLNITGLGMFAITLMTSDMLIGHDITLRITNAISGLPVSGVVVRAVASATSASTNYTSDSDGRITAVFTQADTYTITATASGYEDNSTTIVVMTSSTPGGGTGTGNNTSNTTRKSSSGGFVPGFEALASIAAFGAAAVVATARAKRRKD